MEIRKIAKETLDIMRKGYYKYENQRVDLSLSTGIYNYENVDVYSPTRLMDLLSDSDHFMKERFYEPQEHQITVCGGASFEVAKNYFRPLIMNLADALRPGGGSKWEENTGEARLCYSTSLYQSLSSQQASQVYLYNQNCNSPMFSDYMLLSPDVATFRDENQKLIQYPYPISVLSLMPVNRLKTGKNGIKEGEIDTVMKLRLRMFFQVAARNMYRNLIIAPLDFEVFGHSVYQASQYFETILIEEEYIDYFENIIFIYDQKVEYSSIESLKQHLIPICNEKKLVCLEDDTKNRFCKKNREKESIVSMMATETKTRYLQTKFPFPECNYSLEANRKEHFLGYAQGILLDGVPFVAELMEKEKKVSVVYVLPYLNPTNQMTQVTNTYYGQRLIEHEVMKELNSNLCKGMKIIEGKMENSEFSSYINYIIEMNLLDLQKSDIEGFAYVLYDIAGHKVVAVEISLKENTHVDELVPLRFQPYTRKLMIENTVESRSRIT